MKLLRKPFRWAIIYSALLACFTAYAALDALIIPRAYRAVEAAPAQTAAAEAEAVVTQTLYEDQNISVSISTLRVNDTDVYVADVRLQDANYLKTALAQGVYGKNVTAKTSETASDAGAILAINGDYYGARDSGYVIRGGVIYRDTGSGRDALVIYRDGETQIVAEGDTSAEELLLAGAREAFSFGPALIKNGEIAVSKGDEVGRAMANNPRTAIAEIEPLHYLFAVADGRTEQSAGLSLLELAQVLRDLGAQTAYNLDGGGSSTMYFMGEIVNNPTTNGKTITERSVSDIVYVGY